MSGIDFIVIGIIGLIITMATKKMIRDKKRGIKCYGCSACSSNSNDSNCSCKQ